MSLGLPVSKPRLLDLFCGAGGATKGYQDAGFYVVGVDIESQPNYIGDEFHKDDALVWLMSSDPSYVLSFDLIHASPPCQHFTVMGNVWKDIKDRYDDLLAPTRELLEASGRPYVIENVPGAPMRKDIELCGSMFGLSYIRRHRWFEVNWADHLILVPAHNHLPPIRFPSHKAGPKKERPITTRVATIGSWDLPLEDQKEWMGVDWDIELRELSEAIPPAYSRFIGEQFLSLVGVDDE